MQATDRRKDCNSFTVYVAIGMFVLGVWGVTLPSFFFRNMSTMNVGLTFVSEVYEKGSSGDSEGRRIQRSDVKPPRTVCLSEEDVRLMQSFRDEFDRIGGLWFCVCVCVWCVCVRQG